jgi:hypothetical protein
MSNCDIKDSIVRLRELRDQLCKEDKVDDCREFVIEQLQELHCMIADRKVRRAKLEQKSAFILESLQATLIDDKGEEK